LITRFKRMYRVQALEKTCPLLLFSELVMSALNMQT
jgi:hypothetical protein